MDAIVLPVKKARMASKKLSGNKTKRKRLINQYLLLSNRDSIQDGIDNRVTYSLINPYICILDVCKIKMKNNRQECIKMHK